MHERVHDIMRRLENAIWFANVKAPLDADVDRVDTWFEALQLCTNGWWEIYGCERGMQYQDAVHAANPEVKRIWKDTEEELGKYSRALVKNKLAGLRSDRPIPVEAEMIMAYHVRYACLEAEFADIIPPGFFTDLVRWYERGHFPCGVDENNKLIIL